MRNILYLALLMVLCGVARPAECAETWTLRTVPSNGVAAAPAGMKCGLGYSITNNSASRWLMAERITTDTPLKRGVIVPDRICFIAIEPGKTATYPYVPESNQVALLEWLWDPGLRAFTSIKGNLSVNAYWFDKDPLRDPSAKNLGAASSQSVPFTLVVSDGMVPTTLAVDPPTLEGSGTVKGTITLDGMASGSGAEILLTSSDPAVAIPPKVTITQGNNITFNANCAEVTTDTPVTLTATREGISVSTEITLRPPVRLKGLAVAPTTVSGGESATGTVRLTAPVRANGGLVVNLQSSTEVIQVPPTVTVPLNASEVAFSIKTINTTQTANGSISATLGEGSAVAPLSVYPVPVLARLDLPKPSVTGGVEFRGVVTLATPAVSPVQVALSSSSATARVPAVVSVPTGSAVVTFPIETSTVTKATSTTITANLNSVSKKVTLSITPQPVPKQLRVSPTKLKGGDSVTGTLQLTLAPAGNGMYVPLKSSNPSAVVPVSVWVPEGTSTATFAITTEGVTKTTKISISASVGRTTKTATLTLTK